MRNFFDPCLRYFYLAEPVLIPESADPHERLEKEAFHMSIWFELVGPRLIIEGTPNCLGAPTFREVENYLRRTLHLSNTSPG